MLELKNIKKQFGGRTILDNFNPRTLKGYDGFTPGTGHIRRINFNPRTLKGYDLLGPQ